MIQSIKRFIFDVLSILDLIYKSQILYHGGEPLCSLSNESWLISKMIKLS